MLFVRRVLVGGQERALLIRDKRFERALEPGRNWVWLMRGAVEVEFHNVKALEFQSTWVDYLVKERAELVSRLFTVVETGDAQVAVVYLDGKLARVIGPGKRVLFWRGPVEVTSLVIDAKEHPEVPASLITAMVRLTAQAPVFYTMVGGGKIGLLYIHAR